MSNKVASRVKEIFNHFKLEYREKTDDGTQFFISTLIRIRYKEIEKVCDISFCVSADPVIPAKVILHLSHIRNLTINICSSFFIGEDSKLYFGREAIDYYIQSMKGLFMEEEEEDNELLKFLERVPAAGTC